jgi:hypothetical protein
MEQRFEKLASLRREIRVPRFQHILFSWRVKNGNLSRMDVAVLLSGAV